MAGRLARLVQAPAQILEPAQRRPAVEPRATGMPDSDEGGETPCLAALGHFAVTGRSASFQAAQPPSRALAFFHPA
ncbi:MAG TPA: hypothetical protein VJ794_06020 [Gemmatimonadales bacterium]|nr:hypothetical protein [Gemmatimonadales bacterium]